jgi:3-methyladenine DNA glycosylase AlkD
MNTREVMKQLKAMGTAQNRKIYGRHGVTGTMFGVSYAHLGKLQKKIKVDHELATSLWATGNHDARVLALKVADPSQLSAKAVDTWVKQLNNRGLTGEFATVVARSNFATRRVGKWTQSKDEWVGSVGWLIVAALAMKNDDLADDVFASYLDQIEKRIHSSKNRVRYNMNNALIAIGVRNNKLQKRAVAAAKRIGKVEVDHGETSCKTPDAIAYIKKTLDYRKKKAAKR